MNPRPIPDPFATLPPEHPDHTAHPATDEPLLPPTLIVHDTPAAAVSPSAVASDAGTGERVSVPGYEILGELGRGGMGVVYKARQKGLQRSVALKMVLSGGHASTQDLDRFRGEAEAVACLQHPNIVQIYEVGEADGRPFFSLEYCPGGSLADRLDGTPWPGPPTADMVRTLARAVHVAHQAGIIHRDLKPANVLLGADGTPKVTDFGLAKRVEEAGRTQTGTIMGTPSYMAPEQAEGKIKAIRPWTDVYALGAILYELLTGRPPFKAPTALETILQVVADDPVPPRRLQPRAPVDLETICLKCLDKDPTRRYASAEELALDLERFLHDLPIAARPTTLPERTIKWARRRPTAAALVGVCLLGVVLLLMGGLLYARQVRVNRAAVLVETLLSAEPSQVPRLIEDLAPYRRWVDPQLRDLLERDTTSPGQRLRARLALVEGDPAHALHLREHLLDCPVREFPLIRAALRRDRAELIPFLRAVLRDAQRPARARFHASMALADYDADDWSAADLALVAGQLLDASRDDQRDLRQNLRPLTDRLLGPLEARFRDPQARTTVRLAAADALADLGAGRPDLLARLAAEATPEQYDVLLRALLAHMDRHRARRALRALLDERPAPTLGPAERIRLGRRRAGAALTLLHLGHFGDAWSVFQTGADPEAFTQLVHGARERRVEAGELARQLDHAPDAQARLGLLLTLGDYRPDDLPAALRPGLLERLAEWHRDDPRSAIHAACGWLLRRWGAGGRADAIERTPCPPDPTGRREWFVEHIGPDCFTFVVFPPGTFRMGSPDSEAYRHASREDCHRVRLTRPFALADREVTRAQYERFLQATGQSIGSGPAGTGPTHPATRVSWPQAVRYCLWLSEQAGLGAAERCYPDTPAGRAGDEALLAGPFFPERPGFRLPTDAEWEYACRAGTETAYGFGDDRELLRHYGLHLAERAEPVAQLRPNLRGLFDMHGNVWEWCHDRFEERLADAVDPLGGTTERNRVLRGGGWDRSPWHCRSAYRHSPTPDYRAAYMGFRLARTLPLLHPTKGKE